MFVLNNHFKITPLFFSITAGLLSLSACSSDDNTAPKSEKSASSPASTSASAVNSSVQSSSVTATSEKPVIYASTNMWGAIAKAVGGDKVDVVTAIDSPNQDPHDYQASAKDKLAMQNASLVLVNGGGYDDWALSVADSLVKKPYIINAFALSGFEHAEKSTDKNAPHHGEINEHVFYSLDTAQKVAQSVANQLADVNPSQKAVYLQNAQAFTDKITCLKNKAHNVTDATNSSSPKASANKFAIATESVSDYLLADMGIKNITPPAYVSQSETEAGVSAKVLLDTKNLLSNKTASLLVLNAQTEDNTAKQLFDTAKNAGVGTVEVYETLPAGETSYVGYMNATVNRFYTTLNGANAKPLAECN